METPQERMAYYDEEIAPGLLELAKKCEQHGLAFVAVVGWARRDDEFDPPSGATVTYPAGSTDFIIGMAKLADRGYLDPAITAITISRGE